MIEVYFYDADGRDRRIDLHDAHPSKLDKRQLLWVDATRDDPALRDLAAPFDIDAQAVDLIEHPPLAPHIATFDDWFQFSMPLPPGTGSDNARLDMLVGANWLITVRDCDVPFFATFRDEDRGESFKGKLTATALCASLLDRHIGTFQVEIAEIQKASDRIDADILGKRKTRPPLAELAKMRQRVARLRDVLGDHREIIHALLRPDFAAVAETEEATFFAALQGHFERTEDGIDRARETVLGSFELYTTRTTQDTNEMVSVLTIVTVMIGAVGAIAGIFGMNFDTAFAHWGVVGFYITTAAMFTVAALVFGVAKWKTWL